MFFAVMGKEQDLPGIMKRRPKAPLIICSGDESQDGY
jgi:hypothetical protein